MARRGLPAALNRPAWPPGSPASPAGAASAAFVPVELIHRDVLGTGVVVQRGEDRGRRGEATSLVLLSATALGLASCPITEPLEITETRDAVQIEVFGISGFPQMLLRVGWAPVNADPLPATPRRPLKRSLNTWMDQPSADAAMVQSASGLSSAKSMSRCTTPLS